MRTRAYLAEEGVATRWFEFAPPTMTQRTMVAISARSAAAFETASELVAWPTEVSADWQRRCQ